jgi:DNA-binding transcriptional MerR regulator
LSLADVRAIVAIHERGEQPCDRVLSVIDAELARIERRIEELNGLRTKLSALRGQRSDEARRRPDAVCLSPIIEEQTAVATRPDSDRTLDSARRRVRITTDC